MHHMLLLRRVLTNRAHTSPAASHTQTPERLCAPDSRSPMSAEPATRPEPATAPETDAGQILETDVRLSESCTWRVQRSFYRNAGISAWADRVVSSAWHVARRRRRAHLTLTRPLSPAPQVPFQITTNPWIASGYAKLCTWNERTRCCSYCYYYCCYYYY